MNLSRRLSLSLITAALCAPVFAQDTFPSRPIRLIVNAAPGGSLDLVTRIMAQHMGEKLGQSVIVDNRAGADGLVGTRAVMTAKPDGYSILAAAGTFAIQPSVKKDPGYDPLKDFKPVGLMLRSPFLMMVSADQPDKSAAEFAARVRANPGKIAYASAGVGTTTHFSAAIYAQQAGLQMQQIPYKGSGAAYTDVSAGRVPMMFTAYTSALPFLQSGKMRALGVSSTARIPALPDLPTLAEQGTPGFSYYVWYGLLAPAGTPNDVIQKLSEALKAAQASKAVNDRFHADGSEVPHMSPDEFGAFLKGEMGQYDKLVTELGMVKE